MADDKVVPMPGTEEEEPDKKLDLERLNRVMDAAQGALQEAVDCDLSPEERRACLGRAKRLQAEWKAALEALEVKEDPDPVMVRVIGENGDQEQHEVTFPIYAKGEKHGTYRKIDSDMVEVTFFIDLSCPGWKSRYENVTMAEERFWVVKKRIDFLDGRGPDYWLGRGDFALDEDTFDELNSILLFSVSRVFDEER